MTVLLYAAPLVILLAYILWTVRQTGVSVRDADAVYTRALRRSTRTDTRWIGP